MWKPEDFHNFVIQSYGNVLFEPENNRIGFAKVLGLVFIF